MTNYLIPVLASGGAIAGALATSVQVTLSARQARAATAEMRRLTAGEEVQVLQSSDLNRLGRYLYENIGSTRISNYVGNRDVRNRVTRALDSVLDFLGTEAPEISHDDSAEAAQGASDEEVGQAVEEERIRVIDEAESEQDLSEMQRALYEMTFGEVWNGLARMRRHIESELKSIISDRPPWQRLPLGRLLTALRQADYITDREEKQLRYAIQVANAGIHGEDIEVGQAQEAWEAAVRGLTRLSPRPPSSET